MTNTLTLINPLSLITESLLRKIHRICTEQQISYFIAGATAREILLHHVYGKAIGRRTRDVDFAVFVDKWALFDTLKTAFINNGAQITKSNPHRMKLEGVEVDIIPFGGVAEQNQVAWPPDREIIMSVEGFEEAFKHTVVVEILTHELIPVCSLPGLALLKLFAWRDRGSSNGKDAADLYKIINEYGLIEKERIYEAPVEGNEFDWDVVRMGAFLLGSDVSLMISTAFISELFRIDKEKLADAVVRQYGTEGALYIEQVLEAFWAGIKSPEPDEIL